MMESQHNDNTQPDAMSPALWRGMTQQRFTRRQTLGISGVGLAALILAACGSPSSTKSSAKVVGSSAWWQAQKLNHVVNFANWPYYIDLLNGKHPTLEHFTATTGIKVNYFEVIQDNASFYQKIRPSLASSQYTGYDIVVITNNNPQLG